MTQNTLSAALRTDFSLFTAKVFQTLHNHRNPLPNWHIDALTYSVERARLGFDRRLIINVPPRSMKSIIASVALPAFILGKDPGARLICVSYAQTLCSKHARDFRLILDSPWYRQAFPGTRVRKDTEEIVETTRGGARLATSIGGPVTGFGAGMIIIDDPMKPDEAPSDAARERTNRYFRETLLSRLDDKSTGVIIVVMQRLHEQDLSGYLLEQGGWKHLCLPAIATEDEEIDTGFGQKYFRTAGELLHPQREPQAALDELKRNLGSMAFEAQYQQNPVPDSGNIVKRDWIKTYTVEPDLTRGRIVQSWDTAYKDDPSCDWSVCTTWLNRPGEHHLLDVYRRQRNFPELLKDAVELYRKYKPHAVLIEDQGTGTTMLQTLKAQYQIPTIPRKSRDDKKTRLVSALPMIEAGTMLVLENASWTGALLTELCGFPSARHDDQVDSISQYLNWAREQDQRSGMEFEMWRDEDWSPVTPDPELIAAMALRRNGERW